MRRSPLPVVWSLTVIALLLSILFLLVRVFPHKHLLKCDRGLLQREPERLRHVISFRPMALLPELQGRERQVRQLVRSYAPDLFRGFQLVVQLDIRLVVLRADVCLAERLLTEVRYAKADAPLRIQLRSEEHTSELQSRGHLVCRLL